MVLIGYLAFLDPPKDSAAAAVAALKEYGVAVKVLTGDNDAVTRSVCGQVGLRSHSLLLGSDVEAMDDAALCAAAERTDIFAKLTPQQKARIVTCLRENGHTVGFMGDGINDAAAMKASDVGISVDSAVDIARESADIILLEKDLMVLEQGAIEGRRIYANIIKYIKMTASSNFGNMFSVLAASAVSAVPAAGPAADPRAEPHLRHFVHGHAVGQRRCGFPEAAEDMGRFIDQPVYDLVRARQFGIRHHDVRSAVYLHRPLCRGGV